MANLIITTTGMLAAFFAGAGVCLLALRKSGSRAERKPSAGVSLADEELLRAVESYGRRLKG